MISIVTYRLKAKNSPTVRVACTTIQPPTRSTAACARSGTKLRTGT
jgi:hypothetical protein